MMLTMSMMAISPMRTSAPVFQANTLGNFYCQLTSVQFYLSSSLLFILYRFRNRVGDKQVIIIMDPEDNSNNTGKPTEMEQKHVYDVYDRIAPHFSHTRYKGWPKVEQFLTSLPDHSIVYDIGCGNGKYLGVNPNLTMIGTDRSKGLLETAHQKSEQYQLFAADSLKLPIRDQACDAFISIAVVHHFSTDPIRLKAIEEMIRITRVGGEGLITVWAYEHGDQSVSKKKFEQQDVFVPWHLSFKFQKDLENIDKTDAVVDMEKKSVVYKRYYHVFKEGELDALIKQFPQLEIVDSYYDKENWACRVRRIS